MLQLAAMERLAPRLGKAERLPERIPSAGPRRAVVGAEQAGAATRYTFFCGVLAVCMLAAAWGAARGPWLSVFPAEE